MSTGSTRALTLLVKPFARFFRTEALGGTVLLLAAIAGMALANSRLADDYQSIRATTIAVSVGPYVLSGSVLFWVNDLLMAVFFLLVGLEIKRELVVGELNSPRKAALPAIAAVGGMVAPALIFLALSPSAPGSRGWGVPMATDIAFALGCLRLLGNRIPSSVPVFLAALAIIDDLGAILVIAIFYPHGGSAEALGIAAGLTILLVAMNRAGVRRAAAYVAIGIPLWLAVMKSGVHATIAGVIVGFCVPARARYSPDQVLRDAGDLLSLARSKAMDMREVITSLENRLDETESPLSRLEHGLHAWVSFGIMPLFALANAGVPLDGVTLADVTSPVALGVGVGLLVGKQIGVFGTTYLAVRLGLGERPAGASWRHIYGLSLLAGIGFTMSLFVASLAYGEGTPLHTQAKIGVLLGSFVAGIAGLVLLSLGPKAPAVVRDLGM